MLDLNHSSCLAAPAGKGRPTRPEGRAGELEQWDSLWDTCGPRCLRRPRGGSGLSWTEQNTAVADANPARLTIALHTEG